MLLLLAWRINTDEVLVYLEEGDGGRGGRREGARHADVRQMQGRWVHSDLTSQQARKCVDVAVYKKRV